MSDASQKREVDWILVEADFRAGIKPLRQIGAEWGVSHMTIKKRADKEGWTRNLADRIQAKAEDKVARAAIQEAEDAPRRQATEQQVVEANAELQYRIRLEHRQDIGRTRRLFQALIGELEDASTAQGQRLVEELAVLLIDSGDDDDEAKVRRMRQALDKVMSIGGRVESAGKLTQMLERLVNLERQAFGIKDEDGQSNSVDDLLKKIASGEV